MRFSFISLALCIGTLSNATPFHHRDTSHIVHEKRQSHPEWKLSRRLEGHVPVPLRIALKQQDIDSLPDHLMAVADPTSPSYGKHWTQIEVIKAFAPSAKGNDTVHAWLVNAGFEGSRLKLSSNQAWIDVHGTTVGEVERLLDTEYHIFTHDNGDEHVACHSYSLPSHVAPHVDFVTPTVQPNVKLSTTRKRFRADRPVSLQSRASQGSVTAPTGCDTLVVPDCLKALYNMTYTPKATDRNTIGIVSHYSNTYLQSDLDNFFGNFSPSLMGKSPTLVSIDGGKCRTIELDENTDVGEDGWVLQYTMTLVQPQTVLLLQTGGPQTGAFASFNEWLDAVDGSYCTSGGGDDLTYDPLIPDPFPGGLKEHSCGTAKPPNVASNSQADNEYRFSQFYLQRQCNEFAKLGLMGVTVIYSAGNTGTAAAQGGYCLDDNGSMNPNATNFNPAWPASCPWVTAVGGTQVIAGSTPGNGTAEEVWNQDMTMGFFESGGGGFSNRFPMPDYQKTPVNNYLKALKKNDSAIFKHFNAKGRAYPDLSANANMFYTIENGNVSVSSGTSGAVPTIASIITLVNDARIAAGKKPVGFINPVIYSPEFAEAFNDITQGANQGCRGLQGVRNDGFKATSGWDPASGLGTPNLGKLIEKWERVVNDFKDNLLLRREIDYADLKLRTYDDENLSARDVDSIHLEERNIEALESVYSRGNSGSKPSKKLVLEITWAAGNAFKKDIVKKVKARVNEIWKNNSTYSSFDRCQITCYKNEWTATFTHSNGPGEQYYHFKM
ncbi:peptidase S8/S53 domain-containing protein [Crucibulum laeve]|uniref:Peptidase S8/S53 domain-containing protein n=1 Tax=Crucibulum laeve TaxID=68775 RepID=A0A5C3MA45_9AGAR|nr:peptidase S8/S53 domain-containing protein [Crucibulum laeve]